MSIFICKSKDVYKYKQFFKYPGNRYDYLRLLEIEESLWKNKNYSEDYTEYRHSRLDLWELSYFNCEISSLEMKVSNFL